MFAQCKVPPEILLLQSVTFGPYVRVAPVLCVRPLQCYNILSLSLSFSLFQTHTHVYKHVLCGLANLKKSKFQELWKTNLIVKDLSLKN